MLLLLLIIIVIIIVCYWYLIKPYSYWRDRNIQQLPVSYIYSDYLNFIFHFRAFCYQIQQTYQQFPDNRFFGAYQFSKKALFLRDPELIKQITVRDFDHFLDHNNFLSDGLDPLWNQNLFVLRGQKWRQMRSTLSPVFTSSKIKQMFVLIMQNAQQFTNYFQKFHDNTVIVVEMKDIFTRFTNDVIANIAFGIECDSLEDKNNEFYLNGKEATNFQSLKKIIDFTLITFCPKLAKLLDIRIFSKEIGDFFLNLIKDNIRKREEFNIKRPDLLNILMEARQQGLKNDDDDSDENKIEWTDAAITAQALIFFFAGFESVSTLMSFMAYELAVNPHIQEKLYLEIMEIIENNPKNIEYEHIIKMKYMDMVVSETLRKWPSAIGTDRLCTKPYQLKLDHQQSLLIEKDTVIFIPTFALHYDPKYFPQPELFDPERFNDDNKSKIIPYTYMPFGTGPRSCIGNRLALLETKILFFYLLRNFQIVVVEKTQIPLKIAKMSFNLVAENGFWLGLKKRETF